MLPRLASLPFLFGALLHALPALACELAPPTPLVVDAHEQQIDHTPPGKIPSVGVTIVRGRGPRGGCDGSQQSTSCDDLGTVTLHPTPPTDDRTAPGDLGYVVKVTAGNLPPGATLPSDTVLADPAAGLLALGWIDGANDDQESIDFTLTLTPVDRGGNAGPESDPIRVHDDGSASGCRASRGGDARSFLLVAGLLAVARLATRRGRAAPRLRQ